MKTLLQLTNIHKAYGAQIIFDSLSLTISDNQKIGVIGRNGAGKTTLCRIITDEETPDDGIVHKSKHFRLAYLQQHDPYELDESIISFLIRYSQREQWQCAKLAVRFQLTNDLLEKTIGSLAGGFRTRVKLAAMLLREPNMLVLDEPTNYLDLKTLILLEEFLQDYRGAFLIVSHDREFIKKTCKETLEIENGSCSLYPGTVDEYLIFKEEQQRLIDCHNKTIASKKKQMQLFVDRFRAKASKATQAKSVMKRIEKLEKTIDTKHSLSNVRLKIPQVEKKNLPAFSADSLSIGYPGYKVAGDITMEFRQGEHIAILGDNGEGKTTFMRTIAGDLEALKGVYKWGYNLRIGYYAQHVVQSLDLKTDIFTYLSNVAEKSVTKQDILCMAGNFLFKENDVLKKVEVLSGGEKARLCLAGLLLSKHEVLLLDEPTNHLDFETVEAFGEALKEFDGTVFFISHDRTFVNMLATSIVEVKDKRVVCYPGNYEEYVYSMEAKVRQQLGKDDSGLNGSEIVKKNHLSNNQGVGRKNLKQLKNERIKISSQAKNLHSRIQNNKMELEAIKVSFSNEPSSWSHASSTRYQYLEKLIKEDEDTWLLLMEKIEQISSEIDLYK